MIGLHTPKLLTLGETIRSEREKQNFSLREFAKQTGVSFSQLSKIERGEHRPTRETLEKIALHMNVEKSWLFLLAGYSDYLIDKIGEKQFLDRIIENNNKNMSKLYAVQETAVTYNTNDWTGFIQKMEARNLTPKQLETIVEDYEKIKAIVLNK